MSSDLDSWNCDTRGLGPCILGRAASDVLHVTLLDLGIEVSVPASLSIPFRRRHAVLPAFQLPILRSLLLGRKACPLIFQAGAHTL